MEFSSFNTFQIFLLLIRILFIYSDNICENCTIINNQCTNCGYDCTYYKSTECILCQNLNDSVYYKFNDNNETCQVGVQVQENDKLIYGSKRLADKCPQEYKYQLGSICYQNAPANAKCNLEDDIYVCECSYNFKKTVENNLIELACLERGQTYPNGYYYITIVNNNHQYSQECFNTTAKTYKETIGSKDFFYCLDECPDSKKYYYETDTNPNSCITSCDFDNNGDYNIGTICHRHGENETCSGYIKVDPNKKSYECVEDGTSCPNDYAYLYEIDNTKYCLKSCQYTKSIPFFNKQTYILEETSGSTTTYECLEDVPTNVTDDSKTYYKDNLAYKIVEDCQNTLSGPYHNESDKTCYSSCDNYYKGLECVDDCNDTNTIYYIDEETKSCVTNCPKNLNRGFYNENNICVSCNSNQGFYIANNQTCLSSCPDDNYYHNFNDNFCFDKECKNYSPYKYHYNNTYICYESCLNISLSGQSVHFEKDYICYETDPFDANDDYKYKYNVTPTITKYIKEEELFECLNINLKYLKEFECVEECENDEYKILPTRSKIGECILYNDANFTTKCKYFNNDTKICYDTCELFEIKDENGETTVKDGENCVEECPFDYYKNLQDKTCVPSCKEYADEISKQCVSSCPKGFYELKSNDKKVCVDKCNNTESGIPKFANYLITGECQLNCPNETQYSFDTANDHQLCLEKCPNEKPYHKGNFCVETCDYYYEGDCIDNCTDFSFIYPGRICSNDPCQQSAPFYYNSTDSPIKICDTKCPDHYLKNYQESNSSYENIIECIPYDLCTGVKYNNGCYDKCPDGLYNLNENCTSNCPNYFYKEGNGYKCINSCDGITGFPYITTSKECVANCPIGETFIMDGNKCLSKCNNDYFYYEFEQAAYNEQNYSIYKCIDNCQNNNENNKKVYIYETKECISHCGELYKHNSVCYKNCLTVTGNQYSLKEESVSGSVTTYTYKCNDGCDGKYFGSNLICVDSCNELVFNKTANYDDKRCVNECNLASNYKYLVNLNGSLFCKDKCEDNQRFLSSVYKCLDNCPNNNNYVVRDQSNPNNPVECLEKCPENNPYAYQDEEKDEYYCANDECGKGTSNVTYYYLNEKICKANCSSDFIIKNTNICAKSCDTYNSTKLYEYEKDDEKLCVFNCSETDLNKTSIDGKCTQNCGTNEFYNENDLICRVKCPTGKKIDGNICRDSCNTDETLNKFEDENGYCVDNCTKSITGYIYHKENEYKCLNNCPSPLYIDGDVCKASCGDKFIYDNYCLDECLPSKKFYIQNNKTCLNDCPKNSPFYKKNENSYECISNCSAYLPSTDLKKNAIICLEVCNGTYPYFIYENENDNTSPKICYPSCPSDSYPYYTSEITADSENLQCYKECPDGYVHYEGYFKCIEKAECQGKIKYSSKLCVEQCSKNEKIYEENNTIYCVDNCTVASELASNTNLKLTYDNKCVTGCPEFSEENNGLCICSRLFYYDKSTGYKTCLNQDLTRCENVTDYPIIQMDKNECTDYCNGVLSLSGYECYNKSYNCEANETVATETNGKKRCKCKDKYYEIIENERTVRKCLREKQDCPSQYSFLIKETNQCVENCSSTEYNLEYGKTCVKTCPTSTIANGNKCECSGKWYLTENYDVKCINECPADKNIVVKETNQCVSSCIGTGYEVYYNKTCISSCTGIENREQSNTTGDSNIINIANKYCRCSHTWYYDKYDNEVCKESDVSCTNIDGTKFKYMIESTKQCVNKCPENSYTFNGNCLMNCESGTGQNETSKTCFCSNLWKYNETETGKISCLTDDSCENGYLLIKNTKECYKSDKCPKKSPYILDKTCYEKGKCPGNTIEDEINLKCSCINKWYTNDDDDIICLPETNECPTDYIYFNSVTKECTKNKATTGSSDQEYKLYEFNYTLYINCPEKTKPNEDELICECDPIYGYWYKYQVGNKILRFCGLDQCPENQMISEDNKECLSACSNVSYQGICYQKCPNLTEEIGSTKECQIKDSDEESTLEDLKKSLTDNIANLYKKSASYTLNTSVSRKIAAKNATAEFYGVNKKKKEKSYNNIQSDLSYIDISGCIDKLYHSHHIDDSADIIILKFDIDNIPNNYLIKPVEYRFINSLTGKEIDASVCEHNSIKISYPLHDLINKFDQMLRHGRNLEYVQIDLTSNNRDSLREKFDKGKEIIQEYPNIDIFNINSKIYSDICVAVEIDGKDLILEDRFKYFYPPLSLCENNCTYDHTDFINERVYCDCSYKIEFDFNREYPSSLELDSNTINNEQENSNIYVMKCISNLKNSKSVSGNGGFIYSLIIIIIEAALLVVIIFYGIKSLTDKLKNKNSKDDDYDKININVVNTEKKTYEDIKTSERNLDHPPRRKKGEFGMEFIPQEYLFLFFNQGETNCIKKVERDNVPFKTKYNTRILLEQKKGVNYDNVKPRGPFPIGQNLLVIVDNMDEDINDYLTYDESEDEDNNNTRKNKNKMDELDRNNRKDQYISRSRKSGKNSTNDRDSFKINQKPKLYNRKKFDEFSITDYDPSDENYSHYDLDEDESQEKGFIETLKRNQRYLKRNYEIAKKNKSANIFEILFTEIIDKIYITNILLFTKKFDIFALQLSVYLLCHNLLLVLNALFFDIKTIKKIWDNDNYPGLGYYLGYGFLACLVIWIIYRIILCLWNNNDKIKEILKHIHLNKKYNLNQERAINKRSKKVMDKVKFKVAVYSIIQFMLLAFCFIYLTVFGSVFTGTMSKVFKAYGIALIEILIIKILYGIALGIMRYISLTQEKKGLYDVVLFMDTYLV